MTVTPDEFALLMDTELKANAIKGEWNAWKPSLKELQLELIHHVGKLLVHTDDAGLAREFAADVANLCMKAYERAEEQWGDL